MYYQCANSIMSGGVQEFKLRALAFLIAWSVRNNTGDTASVQRLNAPAMRTWSWLTIRFAVYGRPGDSPQLRFRFTSRLWARLHLDQLLALKRGIA